MSKIKIIFKNQWNFEFGTDDNKLRHAEGLDCSYCYTTLDSVYSYIITRLSKAGLLPDDFKPACCYCYTLLKFGLIDLKDHLCRFEYKEEEDILLIYLSCAEVDPNTKLIKWYEFVFRIHDCSKWA